jgi:hypothetical protein
MTREVKVRNGSPRNMERKTEGRTFGSEERLEVIDDTGSRFSAIMKRVSDGMAAAARGAAQSEITLLEAVSSVVRPALRGTWGPAGDSVMGTKAIVMGVIWGAGEKNGAALKVLSHTARTVIRQTALRNGDVGAAVTGLVRAAIAGSERMGVPKAKAAMTVASVAVEEVHQIGSREAGRTH